MSYRCFTATRRAARPLPVSRAGDEAWRQISGQTAAVAGHLSTGGGEKACYGAGGAESIMPSARRQEQAWYAVSPTVAQTPMITRQPSARSAILDSVSALGSIELGSSVDAKFDRLGSAWHLGHASNLYTAKAGKPAGLTTQAWASLASLLPESSGNVVADKDGSSTESYSDGDMTVAATHDEDMTIAAGMSPVAVPSPQNRVLRLRPTSTHTSEIGGPREIQPEQGDALIIARKSSRGRKYVTSQQSQRRSPARDVSVASGEARSWRQSDTPSKYVAMVHRHTPSPSTGRGARTHSSRSPQRQSRDGRVGPAQMRAPLRSRSRSRSRHRWQRPSVVIAAEPVFERSDVVRQAAVLKGATVNGKGSSIPSAATVRERGQRLLEFEAVAKRQQEPLPANVTPEQNARGQVWTLLPWQRDSCSNSATNTNAASAAAKTAGVAAGSLPEGWEEAVDRSTGATYFTVCVSLIGSCSYTSYMSIAKFLYDRCAAA